MISKVLSYPNHSMSLCKSKSKEDESRKELIRVHQGAELVHTEEKQAGKVKGKTVLKSIGQSKGKQDTLY